MHSEGLDGGWGMGDGKGRQRTLIQRLYSRLATPTLLLAAFSVPSIVYIESVALSLDWFEWQLLRFHHYFRGGVWAEEALCRYGIV